MYKQFMKLVVSTLLLCPLSAFVNAETPSQPQAKEPINADEQPLAIAECPNANSAIKTFLEKNPELAQLNHLLSITYKTALSLEKTDDERKNITNEQCAWQEKTAACANEGCVQKNFQERVKMLSDSNLRKTENEIGRNPCPELPLMTSEADKGFCIRRLTSRYPFVLGNGGYMKTPAQASSCNNIFAALVGSNEDIHYVEPVAHADGQQGTEMASYRACNEYKGYRDGNTFVLEDICKDFRRYQLPLMGKTNHAITEWLDRRNCGGRVPHDLVSIDFKNCQVRQSYPLVPLMSQGFNGIIEYHSKYYLFEVLSRVSIGLVNYDAVKGVFSTRECSWDNDEIFKKLLK